MAPRSMAWALACLATAGFVARAAADTTCVACVLLFALGEQLNDPTKPPTGENPDITCQGLGFCDGTCPLFANGAWPAISPVWPTDGGVVDQRRLLRARSGVNAESAAVVRDTANVIAFLNHLSTLNPQPDFYGMWNEALRFLALKTAAPASKLLDSATVGPCDDALNITCDISRVFDHHLPLADSDGDNFANAPGDFLSNGFRGGDWRGRDCDDSDATVYPGRKTTAYPPNIDHNCNGIYGSNSSGSYEQLFCSGANAPMGIAIVGDSATAHFHLPQQYVNARSWDLSGVLELASNEADWPQCSWSTGYRNTNQCPNSYGVPMGSIYQRMVSRNLCMHRDFQNIGVNGARTSSMAPPGVINALQRDPQNDTPLLVFFALIGNDVCNGHPGFASMTTVPEFQANVLASLAYLDTVLPRGSHVAFLGLANGSVLWDTTSNASIVHPLGVSYPDLYTFLACTGSTPCWGWMNANATDRYLTTQRAAQLTAVYDTIIATHNNYTNFDMYRLNVDWSGLIHNYTVAGGPAMNIIEPVDGFHPSQTGNQLLAEVIWNDLSTNRPSWLPSVNPHNAEITALFGDQGGYDS